jgi:hypothetical protein
MIHYRREDISTPLLKAYLKKIDVRVEPAYPGDERSQTFDLVMAEQVRPISEVLLRELEATDETS